MAACGSAFLHSDSACIVGFCREHRFSWQVQCLYWSQYCRTLSTVRCWRMVTIRCYVTKCTLACQHNTLVVPASFNLPLQKNERPCVSDIRRQRYICRCQHAQPEESTATGSRWGLPQTVAPQHVGLFGERTLAAIVRSTHKTMTPARQLLHSAGHMPHSPTLDCVMLASRRSLQH